MNVIQSFYFMADYCFVTSLEIQAVVKHSSLFWQLVSDEV